MAQAGAAVMPEPEVRAVVLPATGARLMLASDGLWDAVAPKTAAHHVRGMPASKAAMELVRHRVFYCQVPMCLRGMVPPGAGAPQG